MKPSRIAVLFSAVALLAVSAPASAVAPQPPVAHAGASVSKITTLTQIYNNPNPNYLAAANCLVNLSSIADFTIVPAVTQCGHTVTFVAPTEKRSVPGTWPVWGTPNQTEVPAPHVLYTQGQTTLLLRFSTPRRVAGVEATPQVGASQSFKADYIDASGNLIGTVSRTISGGKARLLGARTQASTKVAEIQITSNGDFAIAQIRFKP